MNIRFKKLTETAITPTKGTTDSAGFDLYADTEKVYTLIYPGETQLVDTGIAMAIPKGYFGAVYARSGLATKKGLRPANCVGVIDSDYRGSIKVPLHNDSGSLVSYDKHERIAQIIIQPYPEVTLTEVDDLDDTERGDGGFGSTGAN